MGRSADGTLDELVGHPDGVRRWAFDPAAGEVVVTDPTSCAEADAVVLVLALHRAADPLGLLADVRRVLRPGGTLVVVTPSVAVRSLADLRWRRVLGPVRVGPWRHRSALDDAGWLLAAADFAVLADERRPYAFPLPDATAARHAVDALPASGLWPDDLDPPKRRRLAAELGRHSGAGVRLPTPLRRLVARR